MGEAVNFDGLVSGCNSLSATAIIFGDYILFIFFLFFL